MSAPGANRGLIAGIVAALVVALIIHFAVAQRIAGQAAGIERKCSELGGSIDQLLSGGQEAPQAEKDAAATEKALRAVLGKQEGLLLVRPGSYVPQRQEDKDNPRLFFERRLDELLGRAAAAGFAGARTGRLGFTPALQKEAVPLLLERLAAADRLVAAAGAAGLTRVKSVTHGKPAVLASPEAGGVHLVLLPLKVSGAADERGLILFLQKLSQPGSFLALRSLEMEVTDPQARAFNFTMELAAILQRRQPAAPAAGAPAPPVSRPPVGRY